MTTLIYGILIKEGQQKMEVSQFSVCFWKRQNKEYCFSNLQVTDKSWHLINCYFCEPKFCCLCRISRMLRWGGHCWNMEKAFKTTEGSWAAGPCMVLWGLLFLVFSFLIIFFLTDVLSTITSHCYQGTRQQQLISLLPISCLWWAVGLATG